MDLARGVLFIATGKAYFEESVKAARSCKRVMPDVPILIYTDSGNHDPVFDDIHVVDSPAFSTLDKIRHISRSPFEKTLFLDSDTYLVSPVYEIFALLNQYEFMGTHETSRGFHYSREMPHIPAGFCDINGGVLAFRKTEKVTTLLKSWEAEFNRTQSWLSKYGQSKWALTNDQPSLKTILYESGVTPYILPTEYNALRYTGTYLYGHAKIVHGRGNIEAVAERMNEKNGINRIWFQQVGALYDFQEMTLGKLLNVYLRISFLVLKAMLGKLFPTAAKVDSGT